MTKSIIEKCADKGLRLTEQRRIIAAVLDEARDHPDAEELYRRASDADPKISLATVYRTLKLFEDWELLVRRDFGDRRARYETADRAHHDHLIDLTSDKVIEFVDPEIEALQDKIARKLGYRIISHRMELFAVPLDDKD